MKFPVVFVGHGSPMYVIEPNEFTPGWEALGAALPRPKAILMVSAHWYTKGTRVLTNPKPHTIYDFYGFPKALYEVQYPAPGATDLAEQITRLLDVPVTEDPDYGFDHGAWAVLRSMFPGADIPVTQLSIDATLPAKKHLQLGRQLRSLREQGVLIVGSGNIVHNLRMVEDSPGGFDWAYDFDGYIKNCILDGRFDDAANYSAAGDSAKYAVPTPDHFFPLMYVLGAAEEEDEVQVFNESCVMGSLSMTSYLFQAKKQ